MGAFKELFMQFRAEQNEETDSFSDFVDEYFGFKPVGKTAKSAENHIREMAQREPLKAVEQKKVWILFLNTSAGRHNRDYFFTEESKGRGIKNLKKRNEYKFLPKGTFNLEVQHEKRTEVL